MLQFSQYSRITCLHDVTRLWHDAMSRHPLFLPFAGILALSLAGCASTDGDFPSLSKRPYENANPIKESDSTVTNLTTALPALLASQTDGLLIRSRKAASAFAGALPLAQSSARSASGAAVGSETWVQAHMVLSRLDAARSDGVAALAEMDKLVVTERERGADSGLLGLLETVQRELADTVSDQNARIGALHNVIAR
jgi:hypothetical protein